MKKILLLSLFVFAVIFGMGEARPNPVGEIPVEIVFTCVDWNNKGWNNLYFFSAGDYQQIQLRSNRRSRPYHYTGSPDFSLFRKLLNADGETVYERIGHIRLSGNSERLLLIIIASERDEALLNIHAIQDSVHQFPAGSYNLLNLTGIPLEIELAGRRTGLPVSSNSVMRPEGAPYHSLPLRIEADDGTTLYQGNWICEPHVRKMVFLLPRIRDEAIEGITVRIIPEIMP